MRGAYAVNGVSHRGEMHLAPASGDGPAPITFVGPDPKEGDPAVMAFADGGMGMYFQSVTKVNNPRDTQRFDQVLGDAVDNGEQIDISLTPNIRFSIERARVSWVRSAYLAAFAALGWTYILHESLAQIREQFQAHESATFPEIVLYDPEADPGRREILIIADPSACQSVMVAMGSHTVFLPAPGKLCSLVELAGAVQNCCRQAMSARTSLTFVGTSVPWPMRPEHGADILQQRPAELP
ncbi:hypothetical protein [Actinoplanes campanulatus]